MQLENDLILRAANGASVERAPVWLMRQAGRILKEYREVRNSLSGFRELVETPELAAEVTVQPVDILGVDAAIIFSDILVVCDVLGFPYGMKPGKGPYFEEVLNGREDLGKLRDPDVENELAYVFDAIRITREKLNGRVPLIGFAGAPWTLFCYLTEGEGSKTFAKARKLLYQDPDLAHEVLERITKVTVQYLKGQIRAGAQLVQVFDSWAGILGEDMYREFGLKYLKKICDEIDEVPKTVFSKGAYSVRKDMGDLNCQTIGMDWNMNIQETKELIPNKTLQGNLDPAVLYASDERIRTETKKMLDQFGDHPHIANLGHGVYPDTDPEKVKVFINTVKAYQQKAVS